MVETLRRIMEVSSEEIIARGDGKGSNVVWAEECGTVCIGGELMMKEDRKGALVRLVEKLTKRANLFVWYNSLVTGQ